MDTFGGLLLTCMIFTFGDNKRVQLVLPEGNSCCTRCRTGTNNNDINNHMFPLDLPVRRPLYYFSPRYFFFGNLAYVYFLAFKPSSFMVRPIFFHALIRIRFRFYKYK